MSQQSAYPCRWSHCAALLHTLPLLDAHIEQHIQDEPMRSLHGVKRRRVGPGLWLPLQDDGKCGSYFSLTPALLPSQAGDTTTTTEGETFASLSALPDISSSAQPSLPVLVPDNTPPSQPAPGRQLFRQSSALYAEAQEPLVVEPVPYSSIDVPDDVLHQFLRSPSPSLPAPPAGQASPQQGSGRSISPFQPPTQAFSSTPIVSTQDPIPAVPASLDRLSGFGFGAASGTRVKPVNFGFGGSG